MEDYIVLKTGFNTAINNTLDCLQDLPNYDIIKDRILRLQKNYLSQEYEGTLTKYYDKQNELGYVILDDNKEIKGACIFLKENKYKMLPESELIFVKNNVLCRYNWTSHNKDYIHMKFEELLNKFERVE